ncbi:hypothetical protein IPM19_00600 [bacterium]|nr:MAG: hypothetical protein IPM19_00600 [bacterium]
MRYIFFLVTIFLAVAYLPLNVEAQKRTSKPKVKKPTASNKSSAKRAKRPIVRKTVASKKAVPMPKPSNPLVSAFLKSGTATIVPQCIEGNRVVWTIYFVQLFEQSIRLFEGSLEAFRKDVVLEPLVAGNALNGASKDPRWGKNFQNERDLKLAQTLQKEFQPTEMEFYPKLPQTALSQIVIVKDSPWDQLSIRKTHQIIKDHFGPGVPTNFVSECLFLESGQDSTS